VFLFNLKDKAYKVLEVPGMLHALIILPEYSRGVMSVHLNWDGNAPNVHEGLLWECVLQFCAAACLFIWHVSGSFIFGCLCTERTSSVVDVQWDKLSSVYLLVAYTSFCSLWDTSNTQIDPAIASNSNVNTSCVELMTFDKHNTHNMPVSGMSWLDWTAGNYITCNAKNATLRVWNASQSSYLSTINIRANMRTTTPQTSTQTAAASMGIHALVVVPSTQSCVCAMVDGSIVSYNLGKMQTEFVTAAGHTNTIYECAFCPTNADVFASASYDGTVKVWSISNLSLLKCFTSTCDRDLQTNTANSFSSTHTKPCVFYCVSWSVSGRKLAASTHSGKVIAWDYNSGMEILRYEAFNRVCGGGIRLFDSVWCRRSDSLCGHMICFVLHKLLNSWAVYTI
jgi:WD40 repeat protein